MQFPLEQSRGQKHYRYITFASVMTPLALMGVYVGYAYASISWFLKVCLMGTRGDRLHKASILEVLTTWTTVILDKGDSRSVRMNRPEDS